MSHAAKRKQQPADEQDQDAKLSVYTPPEVLNETSPVAATRDSQSAGPRPTAEWTRFGFDVSIEDGMASPEFHAVRDIEAAIIEKLKEKGFAWQNEC